MERPKCKDCKFYKANPGNDSVTGLCLFKPPVMVETNEQLQWPGVREFQWCGEWKESPWGTDK